MPETPRDLTGASKHAQEQGTDRTIGDLRGALKVREYAPQELSGEQIGCWKDLELRAAEPNAYASPSFLLPALRHLDNMPPVSLRVVEIEGGLGPSRWLAVLPLRRRGPRPGLPLPHLAVYRTIHTFLGSPLVDSSLAQACWASLLEDVARDSRCFALEVSQIERGGGLHRSLSAACGQLGFGLHEGLPQTRSMLAAADAGEVALRRNLRRKGYGPFDRRLRRLAELGAYEWRLTRNGIPEEVVEDFLRLEHTGWKGEGGTSLRSQPSHEAFFREAIKDFDTTGRVFFGEIRLDGRVISSTAYFTSGAVGFSFKNGWDTAYRQYGPGVMNEFEFARHMPDQAPGLLQVDSGALPGSQLDKLYGDRRELITATVTFGPVARWALQAVGRLRGYLTRRRAAGIEPSCVEADP